jgi:hypothetical protein
MSNSEHMNAPRDYESQSYSQRFKRQPSKQSGSHILVESSRGKSQTDRNMKSKSSITQKSQGSRSLRAGDKSKPSYGTGNSQHRSHSVDRTNENAPANWSKHIHDSELQNGEQKDAFEIRQSQVFRDNESVQLQSQGSLKKSNSGVPKGNNLTLEFTWPDMPRPVEKYSTPKSEKPEQKQLHTKRFIYDPRRAKEKADVSKIDYPPVKELGYFAHKEKKTQEEQLAKAKKLPSDKRIIANLQKDNDKMKLEIQKLTKELESERRQIMEKGGNACCCQEMKRQIKSKHNEMINIIELWKLKATEQGIYWGKQVRDLKKEHTKTKDFAEGQLRKLQKAQEE